VLAGSIVSVEEDSDQEAASYVRRYVEADPYAPVPVRAKPAAAPASNEVVGLQPLERPGMEGWRTLVVRT
jgi:hypothetical protein